MKTTTRFPTMPVWPRDERHQVERYQTWARGTWGHGNRRRHPAWARVAMSVALAVGTMALAVAMAGAVAWILAPLIGWGLSSIPAVACCAAVIYSGLKAVAKL